MVSLICYFGVLQYSIPYCSVSVLSVTYTLKDTFLEYFPLACQRSPVSLPSSSLHSFVIVLCSHKSLFLLLKVFFVQAAERRRENGKENREVKNDVSYRKRQTCTFFLYPFVH